MIDQIEVLEERVEALVTMLEQAHGQLRELRETNEQLREQVEQLEVLREQNGSLLAQVEQLENDLEGRTQREGQVRDRLRTILTKIDTIETEITQGAGGAGQG